MKLMAIAGAAAAMLLSASPAAAQEADRNAVCLITVGGFIALADKHPDKDTEDMKNTVEGFKKAMYFHAGVLHERYAPEQLEHVISTAMTRYLAMPYSEASAFATQCASEPLQILDPIADILEREAER